MRLFFQMPAVGLGGGGAPQGPQKPGSVLMAAAQLRGPPGPAQPRPHAEHHRSLPPAAQNHTPG